MLFKLKKKKYPEFFLPPPGIPMLALNHIGEPYITIYKTLLKEDRFYTVATVYLEKTFVKRTYIWNPSNNESNGYWHYTGEAKESTKLVD